MLWTCLHHHAQLMQRFLVHKGFLVHDFWWIIFLLGSDIVSHNTFTKPIKQNTFNDESAALGTWLCHCHHDDVIKWKHFVRYWPFVRGIHQSPVNSSHKGQWHGTLIFFVICARKNCRVNNHEAGYLRHYCTHYDVIVMTNVPGNMRKWVFLHHLAQKLCLYWC